MPNHYYDPEALASYLARTRGEGLIPTFTNIPGAEGFQINNATDTPVIDQVDEEERDAQLFPNPLNFTDSATLRRTIIELEHAAEDDKLALVAQAKEKHGIPVLESSLRMFVEAGLSDTDTAKDYASRIRDAENAIALELGIDSKGNFTGAGADSFRKRNQHIDKLRNRLTEIAEEEEDKTRDLTKTDRLLLGQGVSLKGEEVVSKIEGKTSVQDVDQKTIASYNPHEVAIINLEGEGRVPTLSETLLSYPQGIDTWKKINTSKYPAEKSAFINITADRLNEAIVVAKKNAKPTPADEAAAPSKKDVQAYAEHRAASEALNRELRTVKAELFNIEDFDTATNPTLTKEEVEATKLVQELLQKYGFMDRLNIEGMRGLLGIGQQLAIGLGKGADKLKMRLEYNDITGVGRQFTPSAIQFDTMKDKLINSAMADFNVKYKNILGSAMSEEDPMIIALRSL